MPIFKTTNIDKRIDQSVNDLENQLMDMQAQADYAAAMVALFQTRLAALKAQRAERQEAARLRAGPPPPPPMPERWREARAVVVQPDAGLTGELRGAAAV